MSVCGSPGSVSASPLPSFSGGLCLSASTTLSTSWKAATVVAPAEAKITSAAPISSFFQMPGRGISSNIGSGDPQATLVVAGGVEAGW